MDDYKIKRGKYEDKFFVAVIVKDATLIKPLVEGVDRFMDYWKYKKDKAEGRVKKI